MAELTTTRTDQLTSRYCSARELLRLEGVVSAHRVSAGKPVGNGWLRHAHGSRCLGLISEVLDEAAHGFSCCIGLHSLDLKNKRAYSL